MKTTTLPLEEFRRMEQGQLKACIFSEILSAFTAQEINEFKTFQDFWEQVDTMNAYEDDWEGVKDKYQSTYEEVYYELKAFL